MYNKKMIAMMLTLSMLAASLAGCAGDDDDDDAVEVLGCMDETANNYNADATTNDDSCTYDAVVTTHKIGLLNPITGPIAQYAPPFTYAAQQAISDLNAIDSSVQFELVEADSGCSGDVAATSAQTLIDAGVVGVAGAACSGASTGANAVLNAAGVVQVSYASTSPALTGTDGFWRVVPSDEIQGPAMKDMADAAGATNPAVLHMTNDYGSGLATAFENAYGTDNLCTKVGYEDTTTDFTTQIQAVADAGCSSVVIVSYAADGAAILEQMAGAGVSLPVFGADGIADGAFLDSFSAPAAANGVQATRPLGGTSTGDFNDRCAASTDCAGGIYTSETYDAVMMIGKAAAMEAGANMATHLNMVGTNYAGATGELTFDSNGDVPGFGYELCQFDAISSTDVFFSCRNTWALTDPVDYTSGAISAATFTGATVKIGFLNPSTGPIAEYAPGFLAASQIALNVGNIAGWGSGLQFELVYADSGCDGTVAATGAQSLLDAGVVAVVGAACSGASIGANAVLSAAGVPMISYASTSPALTNMSNHPHFYRVVPSDELQGPAIMDTINHRDSTLASPALIHLTNDYGSGLAAAFENAWGSDNICTKIGYAQDTTDFTTAVQAVSDAGCDSAVLISYAADGAAIVEQMNASGVDIPIFGGDGVAEEGLCASMSDQSLCAGIVATKPNAGAMNERMGAFALLCGASPECSGGIYTSEAFDAVIITMYAYFAGATAPGTPMSQLIALTGQGFVGATGVHTFDANGDVPGYGYCIGDFTYADGAASYACTESWALTDPVDYTTGVVTTNA